MNKNTKILPQITVMNALLCLFVVMIHLTFMPLLELPVSSFSHTALFALNKCLSFCVPSFIFLSGYKLFKSYEDRPFSVFRFLGRRFGKIVFPYIIAVMVYVVYFGKKFWLEDGLLKSILLGTVSAHFYYIVILVQLYILFPLIYPIFKRFSRSALAISAIITVSCAVFLQSGYWDSFFGAYIFYFVFGMFWAKYDLGEGVRKWFPIILLINIFLLVFHIYRQYQLEYGKIAYSAYPIINILYSTSATTVLYMLAEGLKKSRFIMGASRGIGRYSYGIYLYHCLGIFVLKYDILTDFDLSATEISSLTAAFIYGAIVILGVLGYFLSRREKNDY